MDWLEFISKVVGSIVWPTAVIVLALTFRAQITEFLRNVKKVTAAGFTLEREFAARVNDFAAEASRLPQTPNRRIAMPDTISVGDIQVPYESLKERYATFGYETADAAVKNPYGRVLAVTGHLRGLREEARALEAAATALSVDVAPFPGDIDSVVDAGWKLRLAANDDTSIVSEDASVDVLNAGTATAARIAAWADSVFTSITGKPGYSVPSPGYDII